MALSVSRDFNWVSSVSSKAFDWLVGADVALQEQHGTGSKPYSTEKIDQRHGTSEV